VKRYTNQKILDSARGEACTVCGTIDETVVFCHSNEMLHGKGIGIKSHDIFGFYGCANCHQWYDYGQGTRQEKRGKLFMAWSRTILRLLEKGIIR
jgi:hypothetical protein